MSLDLSNSIVKVQAFEPFTNRSIEIGSGVVLHADNNLAIVMTTAHLACPLGFADFQQPDLYAQKVKFEISTSGNRDKFEAKYLCAPIEQFPNFGLLVINNLPANSLTALSLATEPFKEGMVFAYGFRKRGHVLERTQNRIFTAGSIDYKFPSFTLGGIIPDGYDGGPVIAKNQVIGVVSFSSQTISRQTIGVNFVGIRRMLANWIAGKYVTSPYGEWVRDGLLKEEQLPAIVNLPPHLKAVLGKI